MNKIVIKIGYDRLLPVAVLGDLRQRRISEENVWLSKLKLELRKHAMLVSRTLKVPR